MGKNPSIALTFSTTKAKQEVKGLEDSLKNVKKEFEITNLTIQASGTQLDVLKNKIEGYGKQAEAQRAITNKVRETIEQASAAHSAAAQRVQEAKNALDKASKSENTSKEEVQRLKLELEKANNTYERLGKAVNTWNDKLLNSRKAEAQLAVAVKQTNTEIEKHNKALSENIKNAENVTTASGKMLNVYTLIKGLAVGYAGKTFFDALVGDNAKFEQYMASFEVLLGGADKAQKEMERLTQFAAKTPFTLPQTVEAEKRLLAYGVAAKDAAEVMQILGDISMGNAEKLNMISLAYGQVITNAKLYGTELRQFAENGVPLLAELAKMYGVNEAEMRKMVEAGQISSDAVTEALRRMTSEGGKFFGMMEKQSQTMEGLWSTLKDNVGMFARDVGEESFNYLKDQLTDFMDTLNQMSQSGELGDIATEWGRNIATVVEYGADAISILWEMRDALLAVGAAVAMTSILNAAAEAWTALRATVMMAKVGFDAAKVSNDILNASLIKSPWGAVAIAVGLLAGALITYAVTAGNTETETEKLAKRTTELTEEYERNIKAADRQAKSSLGEVTIAQKLASELEGLSDKASKTTEEKSRMAQIVDQLNNKIPNLALSINSETGELNKQITAVYNAIDAYKQLLFVKVNEKKAGVAAESLIDLEDQKKLLEAQIKPLQDIVDKYREYQKNTINTTNGAAITVAGSPEEAAVSNKYVKIIDEYKNLKDQINTVAGQINSANKVIDDSFKAAQDYSKKYGSTGNGAGNGNNNPPPLVTGSGDKARQDAIKKIFNDLKYQRDMDYISEAQYYKKLAELRNKYYKAGSDEYQQYTLEIKQYDDKLKQETIQAEKEKYEARKQNSEEWIEAQKHYGNLSSSEEIAAYERIRAYTKDYYTKGIINYDEYLTRLKELDKSVYDTRKQAIQDEISETTEAHKKILDSKKEAIEKEAEADDKRFEERKKAIEAEYDIIDLNEKRTERSTKLADLQKQEALFQNAATKEGKERLKKIQDEIASLNKETAKENRDIEKQNKLDALEKEQVQAEEDRKARLEAISNEYENLTTKQQDLLDSISKYAAVSAGTLETVTAKIKAMLDAVSQSSVTTGTYTNKTSTNSTTYKIYQTNHNNITDPVSATIFGKYLTSGFLKK